MPTQTRRYRRSRRERPWRRRAQRYAHRL